MGFLGNGDDRLCVGGNCTLKHNCKRYKDAMAMVEKEAIAVIPRPYFVGIPYNEETKTCSQIIPLNKDKD